MLLTCGLYWLVTQAAHPCWGGLRVDFCDLMAVC